jgi:thiol-disulfide isomerase/thioredoxin
MALPLLKPLFEAIDKAINEHGSAAIMKERLELFRERMQNVEIQIQEMLDRHAKEIRDLKESHAKEIATVKEKYEAAARKDLRSQIVLADGVYVPIQGVIDGYGKGPWCPKCFDEKEKLINIHRKQAGFVNDYTWYAMMCPVCNFSKPCQ